jgi:hypothetical protein
MPKKLLLAILLGTLLASAHASVARAASLVPNGDFTNDCAGVPCNWVASDVDVINRDTSVYRSAPAALRVHMYTSIGGGATNVGCIPVSAGKYDASFWYRTSSTFATSASMSARYFSQPGCDQTYFVNGPTGVNSSPIQDSQWHLATGSFTFPQPGSVKVNLSTYCFKPPQTVCPSAGEDIYFDDVFLARQRLAAPADFDGDGDSDVGVFRPSEGRWYVKDGASVGWGVSSDVPVPADYDGDGDADIAVYRPSEGRWYVNGGATTGWGVSSDVPVPADYDGDGDADIAVYRPSEGRWYVNGGATTGWGLSTDVPVPGDYDGDGDADIAVYRPSEGRWYVKDGATTGWGISSDRAQPGDYDGDGDLEPAVFRPSEGRWYPQGSPFTSWGLSSDVQLALPHAIRKTYYP